MGARGGTGGLESLGGKLLLAAASLLLGAMAFGLAAEIVLRLRNPIVSPGVLRDQSLEYESTLFSRDAFPRMVQRKEVPDPKAPGGRRRVEISERGYRGRGFAIPKPPGTLRVVVLGGSSAFDIYAPEGKDWPRRLEVELRGRGFRRLEVINAAVPGHASWDVLGRFYAEIWMFRPDYVLFYGAWNDIKYFAWLGPEENLLREVRPKPSERVPDRPTRMISNPFLYYSGPLDRLLCHSQIYLRVRNTFWSRHFGQPRVNGVLQSQRVREGEAPSTIRDAYGPWGPAQYKLDLALIVEAARAAGARPILLTEARVLSRGNARDAAANVAYWTVGLTRRALLRAFDDCDRAVREVGIEKGVDVIDVSRSLSGHPDLFVDEVHVTARGSEAIARAAADHLAAILPREPAPEATPRGG